MTPDRRRLSRAESDRLLDVGTGPDSLSALLAAAAASQQDGPVSGEAEALVHFRAARSARAAKEAVAARTTRGAYARRPASTPQPRRGGVRVAAAALALTVTSGVAVAETGSLPDSLQNVAHSAFGAPKAKSETAESAQGSTSAPVSVSSSSTSSAKAEPRASDHASPTPSLVGLCTAFRAGATKNPKVLSNPAFSVLVAAAGGVERVANFCNDIAPQHDDGSGNGAGSSTPQPSDTTSPPKHKKKKS